MFVSAAAQSVCGRIVVIFYYSSVVKLDSLLDIVGKPSYI